MRLSARTFNVILADPPWLFETYSAKGEGKSPQRHYPCMPTPDICALPIEQLASQNCVLFLWAIWPKIFDAQDVIKAWGFEYSGLGWEWRKFNRQTNKFRFGGGYGTRKNVEPCLLARRGSPVIKTRSERDFIDEGLVDDFMDEKWRGHSRKPDEQYARIERMYDGPYLELFARQRRRGWSSWGNQVDKFGWAA